MTDWRPVLQIERGTAQPGDPFSRMRPYQWNWFYQGEYYRLNPSRDPECLQRARALAYALEHLPLTIYPEQEFFGGAETFRSDALLPGIAQADYDENLSHFHKHGPRSFKAGWSHTYPDFNTLMRKGLGDFQRRADQAAAERPDTPEAAAMAIALRGVAAFFRRAAQGCRQTHPETADRLERTADAPPETFADALQLMWLVFIILESEGRGHNALGRIDQYLHHAFQRSQLPESEALNLLCHVWSKIEGLHEVTNICIGGVKPEDGSDATNPLSFLALRATALVRSPSTNLSARLHDQTSDEFLLACTDLIRTGIGFPAVFNDHVNIPMLERLGFPRELCRDYALVGCVETLIPGCQVAWGDGRFNMPKVFLDTIMRLPEFPDFEALWKDLRRTFRTALEQYRDDLDTLIRSFPPDRFPDPLLSALTRDCLARSRDINAGGSLLPRLHGIGMMGLATLADSLTAVNTLVFEQRHITPDQLVHALRTNFADAEELRLTLVNRAAKYGNDDDGCDRMAARIVDLCAELTADLRTCDGGFLQSCMASNVQNIPAGAELGATPDGRRAGEPLSDAASPTAGHDRHGPTAFVNSIIKPDYASQNCTVVNMRFSPDMFADDGGRQRFRAFLRRFIQGRGHEMQFNVTNDDMLRQAIDNPERFADLIVRVSGFSAFFTRLSPQVQQDILRRRAHGR